MNKDAMTASRDILAAEQSGKLRAYPTGAGRACVHCGTTQCEEGINVQGECFDCVYGSKAPRDFNPLAHEQSK